MLSFHYETILVFFLWRSGQCGVKLQKDEKKSNSEDKKLGSPNWLMKITEYTFNVSLHFETHFPQRLKRADIVAITPR